MAFPGSKKTQLKTAGRRKLVGIPEREILTLCDKHFYPSGGVEDYNPVLSPEPGLVTKETAVASIGSCFARELKEWLVENQYNYLQAETGESTQSGSARYGEVYNTACLLQIFRAAYGEFNPEERWWPYKGRLFDPYRKGVTWKDEQEAETELRAHAQAVARIVTEADVLVCTAGLSEVWRNRDDGSTFFQVPPKEIFDPERHEFVLTTVEENTQNLEQLYALLQKHNPKLRLIVTLSPVPLRATFQKEMTCVQADTISKSILRVAIANLCRNHPEIVYFPAYELITRLTRRPFKKDNRHVERRAVGRIMKTFVENFG